MIHGKTILNETAMLEGYEWHLRAQGMRRWALPAWGLLMLIVYGISLVRGIGSFDQSGIVLIGLLLILIPQFNKFQFCKSIRKIPHYQKEFSFTLDDNKLKTDVGGDVSETQLSSYFLIRITPKGILLYPQKNIFVWLPDSAFASNEDFMQAVALVKSNSNCKS